MPEDKGSLNLRAIPVSVIRRAKAAAALEGKTMRIWVIEAIQERRKSGKQNNRMFLTLKQAADLAGVQPRQIRARIQIGELNPAKCGTSVTTREVTYYFYEADMIRLKTLTWVPRKKNETFVDVGEQTDLTVKQIATMWQLSTDTVQRLFKDEPGVIALGNKNPRGRRKRITLRIPRAVMERVKKTRSNSR